MKIGNFLKLNLKIFKIIIKPKILTELCQINLLTFIKKEQQILSKMRLRKKSQNHFIK